MSNELPLISCLCVTRGKPALLRRAIECFFAQRYPRKELVLVYESDDDATHEFVRGLAARPDIGLICARVDVSPKRTLGELRNLAVRTARGEYFCQWDDDDWYHVERLSIQYDALVSNYRQACMLTNWIMYDERESQAYFSHFRLWEGSVLCRRRLVNEELQYPVESKSEDTHFTNNLVSRGHVYPLVTAGLYIYTVHGANTWGRDHFESLFEIAQKLCPDTSRLVSGILSGHYSMEDASALLRSEDILSEFSYFSQNRAS
jgi:glycosyltransferase involved in cell wall biosynthesis